MVVRELSLMMRVKGNGRLRTEEKVTMSTPLNDLLDAERAQYPVRIDRQDEWYPDTLFGYVVSVSKQWFAVQELNEAVFFDAYQVARTPDVVSVEDDREAGYIERAVAALGRPPVDFRLPEEPSTADVLQAAAAHSELFVVCFEREPDQPTIVGNLLALREHDFSMQIINPRGVWVDGPTDWKYDDVTRVRSGGRYEAALARFGEKRPEL
ncbi:MULTISPECIES: hypothetical protein [Aeromicrobium]|uniref:hypothetical protein n=1 Tax=Aeromicrobium TaxID=2040 RepID=UPI002580761E|nr:MULTISPECIES: hypothetical protein [Aeromicrobium]